MHTSFHARDVAASIRNCIIRNASTKQLRFYSYALVNPEIFEIKNIKPGRELLADSQTQSIAPRNEGTSTSGCIRKYRSIESEFDALIENVPKRNILMRQHANSKTYESQRAVQTIDGFENSKNTEHSLEKHTPPTFQLFNRSKPTSVPSTAKRSDLNNTVTKLCLEASVIPDKIAFSQFKRLNIRAVPRLAHRLDRVLFSPGFHFLQDPRTKIFNFTRYLEKIRPYEDFDRSKIPSFISASKDMTLLKEAIAQNKKFYSSTSSMTLSLIQFYLFLNNYTPHPDSEYRFSFPPFTRNATELPLCSIVEPKGVNLNGETVYAVTSDKSTDVEILLLALGHCLEALLTTEEKDFVHSFIPGLKSGRNASRRAKEADTKASTPVPPQNVYNYSTYRGFLMRSQLDCYDPRLPGNGTFDLKTRAACAIRYDHHPDSAKTNYRIYKLNGEIESFEREYNDLIRTAGLLKYGFQARIGQMDGIFIAYHSVNAFGGFQYLPLSEIDKIFYSDKLVDYQMRKFYTPEEIVRNEDLCSYFAETQFKVSLTIWEDAMQTVTEDLKGTEYENMPYRLIFKKMAPSEEKNDSFMRVFAVPLKPEMKEKLQEFPTHFKTSFRENLTQKERMNNMLKAEAKLNEINAELIEDVPLLCYRIRATYHVNGQDISAAKLHPYPRRIDAGHEWRYVIEKEVEKGSDQQPDHELRSNSEISEDDVKAKSNKTEACNSSETTNTIKRGETDLDMEIGTSTKNLGPIRNSYLKMMQDAAAVITMSGKMAGAKGEISEITRIVRKYGEVGRIREEIQRRRYLRNRWSLNHRSNTEQRLSRRSKEALFKYGRFKCR